MRTIRVENQSVPVREARTVVIGSGAAGLCLVKRLHDLGETDVLLLTNGLSMGTSRNTGSDKQTYYKLNVSGREPDSIYEVAKTLFDGGAMDGDLALVEAALSARCFYHLADLGVPFVQNKYGEFVGYKTDHDPKARAASAGPLTVQQICRALSSALAKTGTPVFEGATFEGATPVKLLVKDGRLLGVLCLFESADRSEHHFELILCRSLVMATGAPALLYEKSVYPESQFGAHGICFEAGVKGKNLTEWQYGLASTSFRWNVSGSYQQVLPRYVSVDENKTEHEFLEDYFTSAKELLQAEFLKGYEWPFDAAKTAPGGSSRIDLAVYSEMKKGRTVYLDYTHDPKELASLDEAELSEECFHYLAASDALCKSPIERLKRLNPAAIELYRDHGIDIEKEYLAVEVCAQHNNGGLAVDIHWQTEIEGLYVIGEAAGTHGVRRPGGSALNSGQVGAFRAAEAIAHDKGKSIILDEAWLAESIKEPLVFADSFVKEKADGLDLFPEANRIRRLCSDYAGFLRSSKKIDEILSGLSSLLSHKNKLRITDQSRLSEAFVYYDMLKSAFVYLSAMKDYIEHGGKSRGSYFVVPDEEELLNSLPPQIDTEHRAVIQETAFDADTLTAKSLWRDVRPISESPQWFEAVWKQMRERENS